MGRNCDFGKYLGHQNRLSVSPQTPYGKATDVVFVGGYQEAGSWEPDGKVLVIVILFQDRNYT